MGGRSAASGISDKGRKYGTEYHSVLKYHNIKFIKYNLGNTTSPYETMSAKDHRIYVTLNNRNEPKYITMYRPNGKRMGQIDITGPGHYQDGKKVETPHIHIGYEHQGSYVRKLNYYENQLLSKVKKVWYNSSRNK